MSKERKSEEETLADSFLDQTIQNFPEGSPNVYYRLINEVWKLNIKLYCRDRTVYLMRERLYELGDPDVL